MSIESLLALYGESNLYWLALLNFKNKVGDIMNVVEGLKTIDQIIDKMCDKDEQRNQYNKLHLIILKAIEIINKQ